MKIEKEVWLSVSEDGKYFITAEPKSIYERVAYDQVAGPVTITFDVPCPTCGHTDESDEDEPFEITGTGIYRTRNGLTVEIDEWKDCQPYCWFGRYVDGGPSSWKAGGAWSDRPDPHDIVKRIS